MKNIKLVLIGYGNMGKDWGEIIKKNKNIQLIGVVDILEKNRTRATKDFLLESSNVTDNLEGLLSRFKADAIIDTSPPVAHYRNAKIALNYSCHVLGEKPMSLYFNQAEELIALSKAKNKIYMINQNYRRNPIIKIIKNMIKSLGRIYSVDVDYSQCLEFKDTFRYSLDHPLLLDMAIHHFDLVRNIIKQNADSVYAIEYSTINSKFKNGSDVVVNFKMDKGIIFSYRGSWSAAGFNTSFNGQWKIKGENGTLTWDGDFALSFYKDPSNSNINKENIEIPTQAKLKPYGLFLYELQLNLELFINSIFNRSLPDCWCGDNINSLAMVLSAIKSAKSGREIKIPKNIMMA